MNDDKISDANKIVGSTDGLECVMVRVTAVDKGSIFSARVTKEFEYDPKEFWYSREALEFVELYMCMGYSIHIETYTEERERIALAGNEFIKRVSGYAGV